MAKNSGVLYVRYKKNTPTGELIEQLKEDYNYALNSKILELVFLTEIVEKIDPSRENESLKEKNEYCYEALKFFNRKLELVNQKIQQLTAKGIEQEYKNAS